MDEADFVRANDARKQERTALGIRRAEIAQWMADRERHKAAAEALPVHVRSFLEDVQEMDVRKAKAQLQTILKAVHVYRDKRIELEFRGA